MQMIKVQKTFFRILFFFLILGGFLGQSFASILTKDGYSNNPPFEYKAPSKKSTFQNFLFFDSEEEFGEKEDSLDEDDWENEESFPTLDFPITSVFEYPFAGIVAQKLSLKNGTFEFHFLPFSRPLYDQFHQWKFDLCHDF